MLQIDEIKVQMEVASGEIKENGVYAIFGNYYIPVGELNKLETENKDDDENIAMIYKKLLSDGRAVEMARILTEKNYHKPKFQTNTSSYDSYNKENASKIISYYEELEELVNSMKNLDDVAYYKAQILMANKHIPKSLGLTENDDED